MARQKTPKPDNEEQSARFIEAAQAAEVENADENFERVFGRIVPEKRKPEADQSR